MSKTDFSNGTIVEPDYLNAVFAHHHDAVDSDGHCPKVILTDAAEITGLLPVANQVDHTHDGEDRAQVDPYLHMKGIVIGEALLDISGFDSAKSCVVSWRKVTTAALSGTFPTLVELFLPSVSGESNSTVLQSSALPAELWPTGAQRWGKCVIINSSMVMEGWVSVRSDDGALWFWASNTATSPYVMPASTGFVNAGTKGWHSTCIKYIQ